MAMAFLSPKDYNRQKNKRIREIIKTQKRHQAYLIESGAPPGLYYDHQISGRKCIPNPNVGIDYMPPSQASEESQEIEDAIKAALSVLATNASIHWNQDLIERANGEPGHPHLFLCVKDANETLDIKLNKNTLAHSAPWNSIFRKAHRAHQGDTADNPYEINLSGWYTCASFKMGAACSLGEDPHEWFKIKLGLDETVPQRIYPYARESFQRMLRALHFTAISTYLQLPPSYVHFGEWHVQQELDIWNVELLIGFLCGPAKNYWEHPSAVFEASFKFDVFFNIVYRDCSYLCPATAKIFFDLVVDFLQTKIVTVDDLSSPYLACPMLGIGRNPDDGVLLPPIPAEIKEYRYQLATLQIAAAAPEGIDDTLAWKRHILPSILVSLPFGILKEVLYDNGRLDVLHTHALATRILDWRHDRRTAWLRYIQEVHGIYIFWKRVNLEYNPMRNPGDHGLPQRYRWIETAHLHQIRNPCDREKTIDFLDLKRYLYQWQMVYKAQLPIVQPLIDAEDNRKYQAPSSEKVKLPQIYTDQEAANLLMAYCAGDGLQPQAMQPQNPKHAPSQAIPALTSNAQVTAQASQQPLYPRNVQMLQQQESSVSAVRSPSLNTTTQPAGISPQLPQGAGGSTVGPRPSNTTTRPIGIPHQSQFSGGTVRPSSSNAAIQSVGIHPRFQSNRQQFLTTEAAHVPRNTQQSRAQHRGRSRTAAAPTGAAPQMESSRRQSVTNGAAHGMINTQQHNSQQHQTSNTQGHHYQHQSQSSDARLNSDGHQGNEMAPQPDHITSSAGQQNHTGMPISPQVSANQGHGPNTYANHNHGQVRNSPGPQHPSINGHQHPSVSGQQYSSMNGRRSSNGNIHPLSPSVSGPGISMRRDHTPIETSPLKPRTSSNATSMSSPAMSNKSNGTALGPTNTKRKQSSDMDSTMMPPAQRVRDDGTAPNRIQSPSPRVAASNLPSGVRQTMASPLISGSQPPSRHPMASPSVSRPKPSPRHSMASSSVSLSQPSPRRPMGTPVISNLQSSAQRSTASPSRAHLQASSYPSPRPSPRVTRQQMGKPYPNQQYNHPRFMAQQGIPAGMSNGRYVPRQDPNTGLIYQVPAASVTPMYGNYINEQNGGDMYPHTQVVQQIQSPNSSGSSVNGIVPGQYYPGHGESNMYPHGQYTNQASIYNMGPMQSPRLPESRANGARPRQTNPMASPRNGQQNMNRMSGSLQAPPSS